MMENSLTIPAHSRIRDYFELTKPRLTGLSLVSAAVGFFLASGPSFDFPLFFITMLGTGSIAAGAMTLNQWMERDADACMTRTANRPLPAGRLQPTEALVFGLLLTVTGLAVLFSGVNSVAAAIGLMTVSSYLLVYTPLKKKTPLCTVVGAVPGALPPLIGWTAAVGKPAPEAWILFAVLFLWQMPHFFSLAWMYRADYRNAGFQILSVADPSGKRVSRQILLYTLSLLPVSLLPSFAGLTGRLYFFAALVLGAYFFWFSFLGWKHLDQQAKPLFRASLVYLTLLFVFMIADKIL